MKKYSKDHNKLKENEQQLQEKYGINDLQVTPRQ